MRRHGWELPFHPLQVAVVAAFLALGFAFYIFFVPFVENIVLKDFGLGAYSLIIGVVCGLYVWCVASNPADVRVMSLRKHAPLENCVQPTRLPHSKANSRIVSCIWKTCLQTRAPRELFQNNGNHFCNFCSVAISCRTKHCHVCDKCVDGFDHHCLWLNNCVGEKNHRAFRRLIMAALLMFTLQWSFGLWIIVHWFLSGRQYGITISSNLGRSFPPLGYLFVLIISTLVSMVATYLLSQLIIFDALGLRKGIIACDCTGAKSCHSNNAGMKLMPESKLLPDLTVSGTARSQQQQNFELMPATNKVAIQIENDPCYLRKALSQRFSTKKICVKINPYNWGSTPELEDIQRAPNSISMSTADASLETSKEMKTKLNSSQDLSEDLMASHGVDKANRNNSEIHSVSVNELILCSWQNGKLPLETFEQLDSSENDSGTSSQSAVKDHKDHTFEPLQREARNMFRLSHSFCSRVLRPF